ncbi:MAG: cupredoxin domain-containing protein [Elusimicrobia bacterium]|nr:cupredoxin domain-containing protein [Elusimicrobiota bacterium]
MTRRVLLLTALLAAAPGASAFSLWGRSAPLPVVRLALKDGAFVPASPRIPARTKVRLLISNEGAVPAEFESFVLHREQIVPAGGTVAVFVGPLEPGAYPFFDDFRRATKGTLVVDAAPAPASPKGGAR